MHLTRILATAFSLILAACSNPLDTKLVKDQGEEAYKESLQSFIKNAEPETVAVFEFLTRDLTMQQLENLDQVETPRDLILWGSTLIIKETTYDEQKLIRAYVEKHNQTPGGINTKEATSEIQILFENLMPHVAVKVVSESGGSFKFREWIADVYINEDHEPYATYVYELKKDGVHSPGSPLKDGSLTVYSKGDPSLVNIKFNQAKDVEVRVRPHLSSPVQLDIEYLKSTDAHIEGFESLEQYAKAWISRYE